MLGVMTSLGRVEDDTEAFALGEQPSAVMLRFRQTADAVLYDDDRAIDDDAEVERAEADMRLPLISFSTMPVMVKSMESGMIAAVMSAARKLPSRRKRTTMTSSAPSSRFFCTVAMVASTSVVRS